MARSAAGNYEKQAKYSIILAVVAAIAAVAVAGLFARNFNAEYRQIIYGSGSKFLPMAGAGLVTALLTSAAGFFLAFNSAGQKRNTQSRLSWIGFFTNAGLIAVSLTLMMVFVLLKLELVPKQP